MNIDKKNGWLLALCLLMAIAGWWRLAEKTGAAICSENYFFKQGHAPDAFEYFIPAANLALHNRFPYYGFVSPMADYRLCEEPDSISYFHDTQTAGVIVFPSKPPLYSLFMGFTFKLFGIKPCVALCFNIWCLILTAALMPLAGFVMLQLRGLIAGTVAAAVFLMFHRAGLWKWDAEALTVFLATVAFATGAWAFTKKKYSGFVFFGFSIGLLVLCKGYFVLSALFVTTYLLFDLLKKKTVPSLGILLSFFGSAAAPVFLWMMYINPLLQENISARLAFHEKLKATAPALLLNNRDEMFDSTGKIRQDAIDCVNKFHQYQHAIENGFVVISNQYGEYNILNVHNEYCTDGDFHPEWRIIKNSFYNQYPGESKSRRLWLFYSQNPLLGLKITLAKIGGIISVEGLFFYAAFIMMLWLIARGKFTGSLLAGLFLLLNIGLVLILFYGDIRFVQTVQPVALVLLAVGMVKLFK